MNERPSESKTVSVKVCRQMARPSTKPKVKLRGYQCEKLPNTGRGKSLSNTKLGLKYLDNNGR